MLKFTEFVQIQNENNGQETELWNPKDTTSNMTHTQTNNHQQNHDENLPPLKDVIQNLYSNLKRQQIEKSKLNQTKYITAPTQPVRKKSVFSRIISKFT